MAIVPLNPLKCANAERDAFVHVLLVIDQFGKTLGGGERALLQLASLLPSCGFQASILTFFVHPESPALEMATAPIYRLPMQCAYDFQALRCAFELCRFIKQHEVRIVQTSFESSDLWAGLVTWLFSDAKLVWSRRDMGILRSAKHKIAYRLMSRAPHAVFAVSERVREHCIREDHIRSTRAYTIHNGLNVDGFTRAWSALPREPVVTSVGNIRYVKGHDVFVRAAAIVARRYPEVRFSVAGEILEPEYFEELRRLVETLELTHRFRFDGGVTNLPEFLAGADVFVLPSRSEGFSNAILEAMASSLPVIATSVGGNPEAVTNGVTGITVPPEDPVALAEAITELLADPERARTMGQAGRGLAVREFSIESAVGRVAEVYRNLLSLD